MGTYLGIPESIGGAKTKIFNFILERQRKRVNGWTSRFLSKGGKEVLIKSVVSAVPTYAMSCFRLPQTITKELTKTIAQFWWSTKGQTRGMHWLAWKKLCKHKAEGGMGFRVIEDFNTALLAKQLWRLIDYPESLFAKVFKGRYFRNSNPLDPKRSYSPSYGWKSIISARSLVFKGLIKRVGSGLSISVWNDPWIPASRPRSAQSTGYNYYPELTVNQLIDPTTSTWNLALLQQLIVPEDIALIMRIPTTKEHRPDLLGWSFTTSGRYTVKSGYTTEQDKGHIPIVYGPDVSRLQGHSWKIKCPPKMKHFLWQIISGCIPVMHRLHSRGINCDPQCGRCGAERETINHTLFECPPALQVWALSAIPTPPHRFPTDGLYSNMSHLFWHLPKDDVMSVYPWLLWYIWKARNDKIFSNIDRDPREVLKLATTEAKAWELAQICDEEYNSLQRNMTLPEQISDTISCQIDGSWKDTVSNAGLGWYCHGGGTVGVLMGAKNVRRSISSLHTELEALIWAMHCMLDDNRVEVRFYTDCSELVKMVTKLEEWLAFYLQLEESKQPGRSLHSCHFRRFHECRTQKQTSWHGELGTILIF